MLTREEVQKLADLTLIAVSDTELDTLAHELDAVLGYVSDITTFTADAAPFEKPEVYNVMRDDVITTNPGEYTDAIVAEFPNRDGNYLRVKKIL
jgi:aspartyl-tRNA(Asn)/glutamyl-tRNA(Gln) amidotransferase subunit C